MKSPIIYSDCSINLDLIFEKEFNGFIPLVDENTKVFSLLRLLIISFIKMVKGVMIFLLFLIPPVETLNDFRFTCSHFKEAISFNLCPESINIRVKSLMGAARTQQES